MPISKKGHTEAQKLLSYFEGRPVNRIYVSQYLRTSQTIEYVAQNAGLFSIVDSRLNEIDIGLTDGLSDQELQQKFPDVWNAFQARDRDFKFPEGESGEEALSRIESFFNEMLQNNEDIVLVSHDGLIRLMMCFLLGLPVYRRWEFQVDTCGIMEIECDPAHAGWKICRFNQKCV